MKLKSFAELTPRTAGCVSGLRFGTALTLALGQLAVMAVLMFSSIQDDSLVTDEVPHIGAGYSYLVQSDYRLNLEHPPLIKDLAALPLLRLHLTAPWEDASWRLDFNGQWEFGRRFLFQSGNDPDAILRSARTPMILLTLALGLALFWWTCGTFGAGTALLATFFYCFSPTVLAHGRLVTTDLAAGAGFFLATIAFLRFLREPNLLPLVVAGFALGLAFLAKFSTLLLAPILFFLTAIRSWERPGEWRRQVLRYAAVVSVAFLTVYPIYWLHTRNYEPERHREYARLLFRPGLGAARRAAAWMTSAHVAPERAESVRRLPGRAWAWASRRSVLRPYIPYSLGLFTTFYRATAGGPTYYRGEVAPRGSRGYFPLVYLLKEPLAFHLVVLVTAAFAAWTLVRRPRPWELARTHSTEVSFLIVIGVYWLASMALDLNVGVRHLLPVFPFLHILGALGIVRFYRKLQDRRTAQRVLGVSIVVLLSWQALAVIQVHPFYIAYFNELAGGPAGGYRYVVDSNLDWGQDLKRLAQFVERQGIESLSLDYFGWSDPAYYLGDRYRPLDSSHAPRTGWIAVSASAYHMSAREPSGDYRRWLPLNGRVATIGHSIYVFHLE